MEHQPEVAQATERQRAAYRDCASIAIQVAELREEAKECISTLMIGFHSLTQSILQHRADKNAHVDAAMKHVATQLHSLRDFVAEQAQTIQQTGAAHSGSESNLVHQLHTTVLRLLSSSARDKLHRSGDYGATAPMSWNTCDTLRAAVPYAITALEACVDNSRLLGESNQLLSLRQSSQECKIQQLEDELVIIKRDIAELVAQSSRDGLRTDAPILGISNDSIGTLLKQLKSNVSHHNGTQLAANQVYSHETRLRVEVVRPQGSTKENPFREASLRNQNARLRFRLAFALVTKDLMKFRCRRSLAVSAFYYRKLRVKLQTLIRSCEGTTPSVAQVHPTPPSSAPRKSTGLTEAWRSLQATRPSNRSKSAKSRSFQQYVEGLSSHGVTQTNAPRSVTLKIVR